MVSMEPDDLDLVDRPDVELLDGVYLIVVDVEASDMVQPVECAGLKQNHMLLPSSKEFRIKR